MKKLLRDKGAWILAALGLCGILLIAGSLFLEGGEGKENALPGGDSTAIEQELRELLGNLEGVGAVKLYLRMEGAYPGGIAVLCEGGDDPAVQKQVIGLLTALYPIGAHRIYVGKG